MIASVQTFQIAGRGTVKTVRVTDLDKNYRVGDGINLDGECWAIQGVEMMTPRRLSDLVGLIVKRILPHEASCPKCDPCTCSEATS